MEMPSLLSFHFQNLRFYFENVYLVFYLLESLVDNIDVLLKIILNPIINKYTISIACLSPHYPQYTDLRRKIY